MYLALQQIESSLNRPHVTYVNSQITTCIAQSSFNVNYVIRVQCESKKSLP